MVPSTTVAPTKATPASTRVGTFQSFTPDCPAGAITWRPIEPFRMIVGFTACTTGLGGPSASSSETLSTIGGENRVRISIVSIELVRLPVMMLFSEDGISVLFGVASAVPERPLRRVHYAHAESIEAEELHLARKPTGLVFNRTRLIGRVQEHP